MNDSEPAPAALVDAAALEKTAVELAQETAALALAVRDRVVGDRSVADMATKSSATDVVTAGDRECEALVRERLAELRPDDAILGEEQGQASAPRPGQIRWVVDPIDGTVNYTHGLPWFSVSLGIELDGRTIAGAVVEPVSGRVWSATAGQGARLDGRPLRTSALDRADIAVVATGFSYDPARRARQAALIGRVAESIGDIRRQGCASLDLCSVAAGWVDGFYEHGLNPWDWSAGALIAEEAGAVVRRPRAASPEAGPDDRLPDAHLPDAHLPDARLPDARLPDDGWGREAMFAAGPGVASALADLLRGAGAAGL